MNDGLGALIGILAILAVVVIALAAIAFWVWTLVDCATREPDTGNSKIVWILIILFAGIIGSAVYCFVRRPQRFREIQR